MVGATTTVLITLRRTTRLFEVPPVALWQKLTPLANFNPASVHFSKNIRLTTMG